MEHHYCISNLDYVFRQVNKNWAVAEVVKYASDARLIQFLQTRSVRTHKHHRAHKEKIKDSNDSTDIQEGKGLLVTCHAGRWSRGTDLIILNLGAKWEWVVNTTPRPLHPRANKTRYPVCKMLGWLQAPSSRASRKSNLFAPLGFEPRTVQSVASRYTNHGIPPPHTCFSEMGCTGSVRISTKPSIKQAITVLWVWCTLLYLVIAHKLVAEAIWIQCVPYALQLLTSQVILTDFRVTRGLILYTH